MKVVQDMPNVLNKW